MRQFPRLRAGTRHVVKPVPTRVIRAITFDVGGTLIEPWPSVGHIYAEVAALHGVQGLSPQQMNRRFSAAWRAHRRFPHTRSAWEKLVDATFRGLTDRPPSRTFFGELYDRFSEPSAWHIFGDVFPALEALAARGFRLGVISNWDDRLRPLLRRLRLAPSFEVIMISGEAGCAKPGAALFQKAAARFGLEPEAILHVGDDVANDLRGATSAGFQAVHLRRGASRRSPGVVGSLAELP